ncbi:MAG: hypothetical protein EXR92_00490 [Gemmatimonadetes bacterium]|nr:hypothetical protein [Gemmatimonadota bacterium]
MSDSREWSSVRDQERYGPPAGRAWEKAPGRAAEPPESLRGLYGRYCEGEAMDLVAMIPREELRAFYRQAARWASERSGFDDADPLATVRRYARSLLPLPPYGIWLDSYLQNRQAFLERLGVGSTPVRDEPVLVAVRECGEGWHAALCLGGSPERWRGFLNFHCNGTVRSYRTTDIFVGDDADEIRSRFLSFDTNTLRAFLRSVLP